MSQKSEVLAYMRRNKRITVWSAFEFIRCTRLSERIRELEAEGHRIDRKWVGKDGKRVMAYSLRNHG